MTTISAQQLYRASFDKQACGSFSLVLSAMQKEANLFRWARTLGARATRGPGVGALRRQLGGTTRIYGDDAARLAGLPRISPGIERLRRAAQTDLITRINTKRDFAPYVPELLSGDVGGQYLRRFNLAVARGNPTTGRHIMRHELGHALQSNAQNPWSFAGIAGRLQRSPENTWRRALGEFMGETHAHALEARGFWPQVRAGYRFATAPEKVRAYADFGRAGNSTYGQKYRLLHSGAAFGGNLAEAAIRGGRALAAPAAIGTAYSAGGNWLADSAYRRALEQMRQRQPAMAHLPNLNTARWRSVARQSGQFADSP